MTMNFMSGSHTGRRSTGLTAPIKLLQVEKGGEDAVIIQRASLIITPLAKKEEKKQGGKGTNTAKFFHP